MLGKKLGSYRITKRLAAGGMGEVYSGEHELIGRKAAIKVLLPHVSQKRTAVARFFQEAKATAAIGHPGIVDILDFGYRPEDGRAYLIMEFLEGETLKQRLVRERRLPLESCVTILRRVASALGAAHEKGIVHRDLTPANIFLLPPVDPSDGERIKLLDFGIAKLQNDDGESSGLETGTGVVMGTPAYMAPEQCRGAGGVDHRADLYSLGCIFFEMMCGRKPFIANGPGEYIGLQQFKEPPRPSIVWPRVTPETEALILDLMRKAPKARVQDTTELRERLLALIPDYEVDSVITPIPGTVRVVPPPSPPPLPEKSSESLLSLDGIPARPGDSLTTLHGAASERSEDSIREGGRFSSRWLLLAAAAAVVLVGGVAGALLAYDADATDTVAARDFMDRQATLEDAAIPTEERSPVSRAERTSNDEPVDEIPSDIDRIDMETTAERPSNDAPTDEIRLDTELIESDSSAENTSGDDATDEMPSDTELIEMDASAEDTSGADTMDGEPSPDATHPDERAVDMVSVTVDSRPSGMRVSRHGEKICETRCTFQVPRGEAIKLVVSKSGYKRRILRFTATDDRTLRVKSVKVPIIVEDVYKPKRP